VVREKQIKFRAWDLESEAFSIILVISSFADVGGSDFDGTFVQKHLK
jgi:hypothetical protein